MKTTKLSVITKVLFCPHCEKAKRPIGGEPYFFVYEGEVHPGETSKLHGHSPGFVPHFVCWETENIKDPMNIITCCSMLGCGTEVESYDSKTERAKFHFVHSKEFVIALADFKALIHTDFGNEP